MTTRAKPVPSLVRSKEMLSMGHIFKRSFARRCCSHQANQRLPLIIFAGPDKAYMVQEEDVEIQEVIVWLANVEFTPGN